MYTTISINVPHEASSVALSRIKVLGDVRNSRSENITSYEKNCLNITTNVSPK